MPRRHAQLLLEPSLNTAVQAIASGFPTDERLHQAFGDFASLRQRARGELLAAATQWAHQTDVPAPPCAGDLSPVNPLSRPDAPASAPVLPALRPPNAPLVLTGHQLEFYHAGVWAKVVAADELARRTNAIAFDLLVDHDVIDALGFDVPAKNGTEWTRVGVHWTELAPGQGALPAEALAAPTAEAFADWDAALAQYPACQSDALAFFLAALRPREGTPAAGPGSYPRWLSGARAKFERAMGLHVHHVPTSLICNAGPWFTFVAAWIRHASAWAACYNRHLQEYRRRQGIKSPQHPMPDLVRSGETHELPFWIYPAGQPRSRLMVRREAAGGVTLLAGEQTIGLPAGWDSAAEAGEVLRRALAKGALELRPRALTLTMFARLFLADLFIHGIGGALYDQVTDAILKDLFGVMPPYQCVSAAWLLPLGVDLGDEETVAELRHRRHHLKHNPQQAINPFTALHTETAELLRDRRELVREISESLGQERATRGEGRTISAEGRRRRREGFRRLHAINAALHARAPRILQEIDAAIARREEGQKQARVLQWREYFFGLHTMESLERLVGRIRTEG